MLFDTVDPLGSLASGEEGRASGTDLNPWSVKADNGIAYNADPRRISAAPGLANGPTDGGFSADGTMEVWKITSRNGWSHPVHIHFEEHRVLSRNASSNRAIPLKKMLEEVRSDDLRAEPFTVRRTALEAAKAEGARLAARDASREADLRLERRA